MIPLSRSLLPLLWTNVGEAVIKNFSSIIEVAKESAAEKIAIQHP